MIASEQMTLEKKIKYIWKELSSMNATMVQKMRCCKTEQRVDKNYEILIKNKQSNLRELLTMLEM